MEKNCSGVLTLIYRQCFKFLYNIASTFFKFPWAFSMLQVSSSYSYKHKKWIRKIKVWPKKKLCLIGKTLSLATCYSSRMWLSFWFSLKISTDWLAAQFLVTEKQWEFLNILPVKSIHTHLDISNENLEFLAELLITTF